MTARATSAGVRRGGRTWSRRARAASALAGPLALACGGEHLAPPQPMSGVAINPLSLQMYVGDSVPLGISFAYAGAGASVRATIVSSVSAVAEPSAGEVRPSASGVYVRGRAPGTATLTVTLIGAQTITGTVPVTVLARPIVERTITVSPSVRTLGVGDTARLVAPSIPTGRSTDLRPTGVPRATRVVAVGSSDLETARRVGAATVLAMRVGDPRLVVASTSTVVLP